MSLASLSLARMLSTLFFLTISGLSLTAMLLAVQQLWKRHTTLVVSSSVTLVVFFVALSAAQASGPGDHQRRRLSGDGRGRI